MLQSPPPAESASIYDEVDKAALLDLYGKELPTKVRIKFSNNFIIYISKFQRIVSVTTRVHILEKYGRLS